MGRERSSRLDRFTCFDTGSEKSAQRGSDAR